MHQLSVETVRLLSSSQVITSVHATVKELVENSLDAKATNIEVKLENYGLDLIEVRDNGVGIKREDTPFMAQHHYTSKLTSLDDLSSLTSYGFRGEALASIVAVSDLRVTTCTEVDDVALVHTVDHSGRVIATKPSHLGRGTTVSITNLFRNIPVRKQYYKNSAKRSREDFKRVEDVILAFGIAHPMVRLVLKHNKSVVWQKLQTTDFRSNLNLVLGSSTVQNMVPISFQSFEPMLKVHGFVPKLDADPCQVFRTTADRIFLFVNQRPVVVKPVVQLLKQALMEAFPSRTGRYPVAVVCIDLLPSDLDVNLEPNKTAVLFHDMEFVMSTLTTLLSEVYSRPKEDSKASKTDSSPSTDGHTQTAVDTPTDAGNIPTSSHSLLSPEEADCDTADAQERPSVLTSPSTPALASDTTLPSDPTGHVPCAPDDLDNDDFDEILASGTWELDCEQGVTLEDGCSAGSSGEVPSEQTHSTSESTTEGRDCSSREFAQDISIGGASVDKVVRDNGVQRSSSLASDTPTPPDGSGDSEAAGLCEGLCERLQLGHRAVQPGWCELLDMSEFEEDGDCVELGSDVSATHSGHSRADGGDPVCQDDRGRRTEESSQRATLSQWSRGEALKDSAERPVEPVRVLKPASTTPPVLKQSKLTYKGPPPVYDMIDSRPVKRKAHHSPSEGDHKKQKKGSTTPLSSILLGIELHRREKLKEKEQEDMQSTPDPPSESAPYILSEIEQRSTIVHADSSGESMPPQLVDAVVGYCNPPGVWLVLLDKSITCFDALRASEDVLHWKLLQSHKLLREPLQTPLVLSESILGGSGNVSLLLSLKFEENPLDGCCYCCDDNIVKNGFGVVQRRVGGQLRLELSHTCKMLPSYGAHNLRELLGKMKALKRQESSASAVCRPVAVEQFLQREAARMAKARLSSLRKADVQDLLAVITSDEFCADNTGLRSHFHHICTLSNND